jgi:hypothetical protein
VKNPEWDTEWERARRKLEKAPILRVSWSWKHPYFAKFRLANAAKYKVWWLDIDVRAPWLEQSARTLHPELFKSATPTPVGAA